MIAGNRRRARDCRCHIDLSVCTPVWEAGCPCIDWFSELCSARENGGVFPRCRCMCERVCLSINDDLDM
jgi:hypothetical protein